MPCMAVPFYDCFYEMFHYLCGICKVEIQLGSAVFSNILVRDVYPYLSS